MFTRKSKDKTHALDETIADVISEIKDADAGSEQQSALVVSLETLMTLRIADKASAKYPVITPDAIASIAANLLGIGLILGFEKANVITSKGLNFVPKINV